jgi:hypothetical protein
MDRRRRATRPAITPVATPFSVEPTTIVSIRSRAAGENQAEAPSRNPRIAPTVTPRTGLLIRISLLAILITHYGPSLYGPNGTRGRDGTVDAELDAYVEASIA